MMTSPSDLGPCSIPLFDPAAGEKNIPPSRTSPPTSHGKAKVKPRSRRARVFPRGLDRSDGVIEWLGKGKLRGIFTEWRRRSALQVAAGWLREVPSIHMGPTRARSGVSRTP
jgi:hypothetical protein